jgi:hypothetical protein
MRLEDARGLALSGAILAAHPGDVRARRLGGSRAQQDVIALTLGEALRRSQVRARAGAA